MKLWLLASLAHDPACSRNNLIKWFSLTTEDQFAICSEETEGEEWTE